MDAHIILKFLTEVAANNNRPWFQQHKAEYELAKAEYEQGVDELIRALAAFDSSVANLTAKDCCFRFYRDIRFSADKSPYKRHFGAYISAHGKKGLHGGYYLHLQPGRCLVAGGCWWLPTNILTSVRNEIMGNIDEWRRCVEDKEFVRLFGRQSLTPCPSPTERGDAKPVGGNEDNNSPLSEGEGSGERLAPQGFGMNHLKKLPKDFPKDYEFPDYLKMKDYCAWRCLDDSFFSQKDWAQKTADMLRVAKPMMDFVNGVVDDYE